MCKIGQQDGSADTASGSKPDDLSLISKAYKVKEEHRFWQVNLWPLHSQHAIYIARLTSAHGDNYFQITNVDIHKVLLNTILSSSQQYTQLWVYTINC